VTQRRTICPIWQENVSDEYSPGNSTIRFCCTLVTLLERNQRPGAITMSRTLRSLALSAALLAATTASAFADMPGGTNPPPRGSVVGVSLSSVILSFFGM
jgi:hypothetical protein